MLVGAFGLWNCVTLCPNACTLPQRAEYLMTWKSKYYLINVLVCLLGTVWNISPLSFQWFNLGGAYRYWNSIKVGMLPPSGKLPGLEKERVEEILLWLLVCWLCLFLGTDNTSQGSCWLWIRAIKRDPLCSLNNILGFFYGSPTLVSYHFGDATCRLVIGGDTPIWSKWATSLWILQVVGQCPLVDLKWLQDG